MVVTVLYNDVTQVECTPQSANVTGTLSAVSYPDDGSIQLTVRFSDGTELEPSFRKTGERQTVDFPPREVEWLIVERLIKDPEDPSPFPALTQLEAWGTEVL